MHIYIYIFTIQVPRRKCKNLLEHEACIFIEKPSVEWQLLLTTLNLDQNIVYWILAYDNNNLNQIAVIYDCCT